MVRWFVVPIAIQLLAAPAAAQRADFLFGHPRLSVALRAGWAAPAARSEIFDFTTEELTVERDDFAELDLQVELGIRLRDRLDLAFTLGHSESEIASEFRDWVDTDDLPIEQVTRFARTPITLGVKSYVKPRGRAVGRFAWVPQEWAPYLTVGGGLMRYQFEQKGDFVDAETLDVFGAVFNSEGTVPTAHLGAGLDVSLGPHFLATAEARYLWAKADLSGDFVDFDRIDLSGAQMTLGLAVRF